MVSTYSHQRRLNAVKALALLAVIVALILAPRIVRADPTILLSPSEFLRPIVSEEPARVPVEPGSSEENLGDVSPREEGLNE